MQAADFPYVRRFEVIYRDIDAMGHVNNAVYVSHMETIRTQFFTQLGDFRLPGDFPFILAEVTCTFRAPAFFGEMLTAGTGVSRLGRSSFEMLTAFDGPDGRRIVQGRSVIVTYDYAAGRSIPVPDTIRARIEAIQGDWQPPAW